MHDLDLSEAQVEDVAFYGDEALDFLKQAVSAFCFFVYTYIDKLNQHFCTQCRCIPFIFRTHRKANWKLSTLM